MTALVAVPQTLDQDSAVLGLARRLREFLRSRWLLVGVCIFGVFVVIGIIGPILYPNANAITSASWAPPSSAHWLGTTQLGQDVFAQTLVSARASLEIGAGVGLLHCVISVIVGIGGGYAGGVLDEGLALLSNLFLVVPAFPLIIILSSFIHTNGVWLTIVVIGCVSWAGGARVLRAQTLSARNREYVLAARASGERTWRILFCEILPGELPIIVTQFIHAMLMGILAQAGLAFLGLGNPEELTWGTMLYYAQNDQALSSSAWWWLVPPGACIALFGTGLALINFGLDQIFNPRLRVYKAGKRQRLATVRPR